ncbi:MAG: hypothetical protein NTZ67_04095 [Gammaproteobacteria bacterium]|nr:hypothetical protein [Gammaproteobacteria bacterium]
MKKEHKIVAIVISTATLALSNTTFAAAPAPSIFTPLENFITQFYTTEVYPSAIDFKKAQTINTATTSTPSTLATHGNPAIAGNPKTPYTQAAAIVAQHATSANLENSLLQFPHALLANVTPASHPDMLKNTVKTAEKVDYGTYFNDNTLASLTTTPRTPPTSNNPGTQASDTLYLNEPTALLNGKSTNNPDVKALTEPKIINNDFLNFAAFITPMAYTTPQKINAMNFVKYAAQSTKNLTSGVNFSGFADKATIQNLPKMINSQAYQKYMFTVRSLLALRSISINTLNQLIAERTPMPGLAAAAGLTGTAEASPLQVESYQANHRVSDPKWYTKIKNDSPATVQRETLIVLAEMEQQNFQAHLDSERLLSAITALNLSTSSSEMDTGLKKAGSDLSGLVTNLTRPGAAKK